MLFDPKLTFRGSDDPEIDACWKQIPAPVRLHKGVWENCCWNPEIDFVCEQFVGDAVFNPHTAIWTRRFNKRMDDRADKGYRLETTTFSPLKMRHLHKKPLRKMVAEYSDEIVNVFLPTYGVCDNYQQLLDMYDFENDPRLLFISMVEIRREFQPERDGWRYHKWGLYIGTQNPQCEYIYVWTFHIYEMKEIE